MTISDNLIKLYFVVQAAGRCAPHIVTNILGWITADNFHWCTANFSMVILAMVQGPAAVGCWETPIHGYTAVREQPYTTLYDSCIFDQTITFRIHSYFHFIVNLVMLIVWFCMLAGHIFFIYTYHIK